jgi:hypothetical protein
VNSYDIRFWQIETRKGKTVTYRVPLGRRRAEVQRLVHHKELAESHRAKLRAAARRGEGFDTDTGPARVDGPHAAGRPSPALRRVHGGDLRQCVGGQERASVIETLTRIVPVVVTDLKGAPERRCAPGAAQAAESGRARGELDDDEARAISWIARASRPVGSSLTDPAVVQTSSTPSPST